MCFVATGLKQHSRHEPWSKNRFIYLIGGLEHGFYFSHHIGNVIIPTDELIVFRGVGWNHQPDVRKTFPPQWPFHIHLDIRPFCQAMLTGWWFQTWIWYVHFIYGDVILPIDELHHFSRWLKHVKTTNQISLASITSKLPCEWDIYHRFTINITINITIKPWKYG